MYINCTTIRVYLCELESGQTDRQLLRQPDKPNLLTHFNFVQNFFNENLSFIFLKSLGANKWKLKCELMVVSASEIYPCT